MAPRPLLILKALAGVVCRSTSQQFSRTAGLWVAYLGILAALEEGSDADESDVVVPHDDVLSAFSWDLVRVLEDCSLD
ncbi:uncharacterized protein BKA78DRAFT_307131 [Phyllosticta capitalensis]|uniref:uncharacterized protein n=1 Tax=Phyllosticta capitalensis TaxID=121624 RepID=UPI003131CA0E